MFINGWVFPLMLKTWQFETCDLLYLFFTLYTVQNWRKKLVNIATIDVIWVAGWVSLYIYCEIYIFAWKFGYGSDPLTIFGLGTSW